MILFLHVLIAISSIIYTAFVFFSPSKKKLHISYVFVTATLLSGTYLVILKPGHLVQSCLMGIAYLGVMMVGIVSAHYKLAKQEKSSR
jgi:multisubunit Na+/H+ antiporter MnhE subunit